MSQPLEGIRVLDLGQIYQGPYCGMILSYMGADVIKIEPPGGETVRDRSDDGQTPEFQLLNPNKRGIVLDLKSEEGKEALLDLVEKSDVLIENFASGTLEKMGVGYEQLQSRNPQLIYGHGSGYGNSGPYKKYPAMDLTIQAMGGIMHTTGFPESPPVKAGPAVSDFLGGIHLATGILGALFKRERTGEGEFVEVGMFDCIYPTLTSPIAAAIKEADVPPRTGNRHSGLAIAPYNVYEIGDGYIAIICIREEHWDRLVEEMGRKDLLEDSRFESKQRRAENVDLVDQIVQDWLEDKNRDKMIERLLNRGVPVAPVQSVEEMLEDPHLKHRNMLNHLPNQGEGRADVPVPGMPIKFADSDEPEVTPSPDIGEHTIEVLREICGYSEGQIENIDGERQ